MAIRQTNAEDLLVCLYLIISMALKSEKEEWYLPFLAGMKELIQRHSDVWRDITEEEFEIAGIFGAQMLADVGRDSIHD